MEDSSWEPWEFLMKGHEKESSSCAIVFSGMLILTILDIVLHWIWDKHCTDGSKSTEKSLKASTNSFLRIVFCFVQQIILLAHRLKNDAQHLNKRLCFCVVYSFIHVSMSPYFFYLLAPVRDEQFFKQGGVWRCQVCDVMLCVWQDMMYE